MKKKPKHKTTPPTGRVRVAGETGGKVPEGKPGEKNFPSKKAQFASAWKNISDEKLAKIAAEIIVRKEPIEWDSVQVLKSVVQDLSWLVEGPDGAVSNPEMRVQNEFKKRSADAFLRQLALQEDAWRTTGGMIAEAESLIDLAEELPKASKAKEQRIAMECWEGLRFLYAQGKFPGFWKKLAKGERPLVHYVSNTYCEVIGTPFFPLAPWKQLGEAHRKRISNALVGGIDNTARVLELRDWMVRLAYPSAVKLDELLRERVRAECQGSSMPDSVYEHSLESCDDMVSLVVVSVKWDAPDSRIADDFEVELGKLRKARSATTGRGRQSERDGRTLRGLAGLWLESAGLTKIQIADAVYALPKGINAMKGSRTNETDIAMRRAAAYTEDLLSALRECAPIDPDDVPSLNEAIEAFLGKRGN